MLCLSEQNNTFTVFFMIHSHNIQYKGNFNIKGFYKTLFIYIKMRKQILKNKQKKHGTSRRKVYGDESFIALDPLHSEFSLTCLLVDILRVKGKIINTKWRESN